MKVTALVTALAGVASAHVPAHLARQADETSPECQQARDALSYASLPQPTALHDLSASYYETATRTESRTIFECAWVTEIPESAYTAVAEFFDEQTAWIGAAGHADLLYNHSDKCGTTITDGITYVHGLTPQECFECTPSFHQHCYSEWRMTTFPRILESKNSLTPGPPSPRDRSLHPAEYSRHGDNRKKNTVKHANS